VESTCIFCGKAASSKEHIIPRWLQKHFGLKDQLFSLWNNTSLKYSKATIPACKACNSEGFSLIEKKVSEGTATKQEYYIWSLKIRYCLSIKDSTLPFDRKNPDRGPLLNNSSAKIGSDFVKEVFTNVGKRFSYNPYPFGSVFLNENPINDGKFGFADIPHPYWGLTISLPENKFLSVLFTDRGLVKREIIRKFKKKGGIKSAFQPSTDSTNIETKIYLQIITFNLLLLQYNISNIPYGYKIKKTGIYSDTVPKKIRYKERLKKHVLQDMSNLCGLGDSYGDETYEKLQFDLRG
jgi:hypothetical protein